MSRAFVRESDLDRDLLPERPQSSGPNLLTPGGLRQLDARIAGLEQERTAALAAEDRVRLAEVERDLRYWQHRRANARVIETAATPVVARFGVEVELLRPDGSYSTFRIVGEDETDPAQGRVSWCSPVGRILTGHSAGDEIELLGQPATITALRA
jgi:transcription elongation GreA/GreB family factor